MRIRKASFVALLLAIMMVVSACGATTTPAPAAPTTPTAPAAPAAPTGPVKNNVSIGMTGTPGSPMIPQFNTTGQSRFILRFMFSQLVRWDENGQIAPKLAASYSVTPDGLTYTFNLNKNATWHDGKPLTAHDVAFTVLTMTNPAYTLGDFNFVKDIKGAAARKSGQTTDLPGLEVVDDHTFKITTATSSGPFMELFGVEMSILPKHVFETIPVAEISKSSYAFAPTVGSGPYKFVKFETDQFVEMVAYDKYFEGAPKIERLFIKFLSADLLVAQLQSGELDVAAGGGIGNIAPGEVARVKSLPNLEVFSVPGSTLYSLFFDMRNPAFKDQKVRQAFAHAIPKAGIITRVLEGQGTAAIGPLFASSAYFNKNLKDYAYDQDLAKKMLTEAGWDFNQEIGYMVPTGNRPREQASVVIQQALTQIGVKIKIEQFDLGTVVSKARSETVYGLTILNNRGFKDPDMHRRLHSTTFNSGVNVGRYNSPEVDDLLVRGQQLVDPAQRLPLYLRIQELVHHDLPIIPLFYENDTAAHSKKIKGPAFNSNSELSNNVHLWTIDG